MAQSCTIYCESTEVAAVADLGETLFGAASFDGEKGRWSSLTVHGGAGELTVDPKVFQHNGDDFSRLRLSTYMAIKNTENADGTIKHRVLKHVEMSELILGIVATPSLDADDRYHQFVFEIARAMNGLIFDGSEFLDPDGTTLLELG